MAEGSAIFKDSLLSGQVCVVSGAGAGIGRETALELTRLGATVVGCGRSAEPLEETARLAADLDGAFDPQQCDIRDADAVDALIAGALERHGRIDTLVNNAGGQFLSPAEDISPKGFRTVIELNVQGTWQMTHAAATKAFIPQGGGKVVSITVSPHNGMPGMVHTGAARAGVENMMRTLSVEWARFGVKLCAIAVGQVETETLKTKYPKQLIDTIATTIPLGHLGKPEHISWLVAYLASPAGDFASGAIFTIDGARDNFYGAWPPAIGVDDEGRPLAEARKAKPGED